MKINLPQAKLTTLFFMGKIDLPKSQHEFDNVF